MKAWLLLAAIFVGIPLAFGVLTWFVIDPHTAMEKILSVFACGFVSLLTLCALIVLAWLS